MEDNRKLRLKLIIAIILFILALAIMGLGIWASQAGKDIFKGYIDVEPKDIDAKVTAQITGVKTTEGEGYSSPKTLWDSEDLTISSQWKDIDLTFASVDSVIEIVIIVENRSTESEIVSLLEVKVGNTILTTTEQMIGSSNVKGRVEEVGIIDKAVDASTPTKATFKVILEIDEKKNNVNPTDVNVNLSLESPTI